MVARKKEGQQEEKKGTLVSDDLLTGLLEKASSTDRLIREAVEANTQFHIAVRAEMLTTAAEGYRSTIQSLNDALNTREQTIADRETRLRTALSDIETLHRTQGSMYQSIAKAENVNALVARAMEGDKLATAKAIESEKAGVDLKKSMMQNLPDILRALPDLIDSFGDRKRPSSSNAVGVLEQKTPPPFVDALCELLWEAAIKDPTIDDDIRSLTANMTDPSMIQSIIKKVSSASPALSAKLVSLLNKE